MTRSITLLAVLFGCGQTANPADPEPRPPVNESSIDGLWSARHDFGQLAPGNFEIVVETEAKSGWTASRSGVQIALDPKTHAASWEDGELRLRTPTADSKALVGHWVQSPSPLFGYKSASPLRLEKDGDVWRGTVSPLVSRIELFLSVRPDQSGTTTAFFREHSRNLGRRYGVMTLSQAGSEYTFTRSDGETAFRATLKGESLAVRLEPPGLTLEFTRRPANQPGAFAPRAHDQGRYRYAPPAQRDDGWLVATRGDLNIDDGATDAMFQAIIDQKLTTWRDPALHAILVARNGRLVIEEYFHGTQADEPHDTRSAGKSLGSALVGIAQDRKLLSVSDPMTGSMGPTQDERKARITIEHLITMTSGLECDDDNYDSSAGNEDRMQQQQDQPDWHRYSWDLPMVRDPGEKGVYCSGGINLLGAALAKATGMWLPDFFATAVAQPLSIDHYHFNLMPTGEGYLGGGIRLRPRDFLKLAQVFLDRGRWNGKRIVSEQWVAASQRAHSSINVPSDYGYAWWRQTFTKGDKKIETYFASGNGGQMAFVVPELSMAVAIMAGNYGDGRTRNQFRDRLMSTIIGAAR